MTSSSSSQSDQLLGFLGNKIGIPDLEFDEEGFCLLTVNNEIAVTVRKDIEREKLIFLSVVQEGVPENLPSSVVRELLIQNMCPVDGYAGIGLDERSSSLMLHQSLDITARTEGDDFVNSFGGFVELLEQWAKLLARGADLETPDREIEEEVQSHPDDFLRV